MPGQMGQLEAHGGRSGTSSLHSTIGGGAMDLQVEQRILAQQRRALLHDSAALAKEKSGRLASAGSQSGLVQSVARDLGLADGDESGRTQTATVPGLKAGATPGFHSWVFGRADGEDLLQAEQLHQLKAALELARKQEAVGLARAHQLRESLLAEQRAFDESKHATNQQLASEREQLDALRVELQGRQLDMQRTPFTYAAQPFPAHDTTPCPSVDPAPVIMRAPLPVHLRGGALK